MLSTPKNRRTKAGAAVIGALAAAGLVVASAATLGGLNAGDLGAEYSAVASCDSDGIIVNWDPSYDAATPGYSVGDVDITDIAPACVGQNIKVELTGAAGAPLGEQVDLGAVTAPGYTVTFAPGVDAQAVEGIAVTIYK